MIDIVHEIEAVQRDVGVGRIVAGDGREVRLRRKYDAAIDDVWDALTNPERIGRWFLPISGDYRLGGRYQFEGNAGGEIRECQRPHRLLVTWVYGEVSSPADVSEIELRLSSSDDGATTLELAHTAIVPDEFWSTYGPGAVGVGWDGGLLGLSLHLAGGSISDPVAWQLSDEGRAFSALSSEAWGVAYAASGADPADVASAVANTTQFYAPNTDSSA